MDLSIFLSYNLLPWQWVVWIALGLAIGLTKAGFAGFAGVIIPVIALIFGARESTGLVLPLLLFADILAVIYYHSHAEWRYIIRLVPWSFLGFGVAIVIDHLIPVQAFRLVMGGTIMAGLLVMIWSDFLGKEKAPPTAWWFSALFGIAGGFATTFGNVAGPILAVYLLSMRLPKNSFVGTTAWFLLIINLSKLPIQGFLWHNISVQSLLFNLTLVPVIILGVLMGIVLIKKIPEGAYRKVIMALTLVSTILLFVDFSRFIPA
ncbi:MAG: sulfite exporter TauE/SafE family protein [Treponema sp.]|nr:sulfite exporter TauE/SafE family protein [Treponema sp.]